jgi:glycosyltransferase involved in cell wall biosynthesis
MNALKILLISSVLPRDTIGGEVVLYRHLSPKSELSLSIATNDSQGLLAEDIIEIPENRLLNRLKRTRISKWVHDIRQCFDTFHDTKKLRIYIKHQKPDIILTVAHHELCWLAQKISQEFNIPLVTFFHDWWPDMAYVHSFARKVLIHRFKRLYQQSHLAFCVSEEMRQALGKHPNAQILFPIPKHLLIEKTLTSLAPNVKFTVIYAGNFSGIYGSMIQALCTSIAENYQLQLKLFGPQPDWEDFLVQQVKDRGIYGGFVANLDQEINNANALLVAMSFNQLDKMRMQTSFPSKLVGYCQFSKPIIIWGPEYCSAVRWARKNQSALVVTSPLVQDLVKAIEELATQPKEQNRLGNKALEMNQVMFNQENIQQQFMDNLYHVADLKEKN